MGTINTVHHCNTPPPHSPPTLTHPCFYWNLFWDDMITFWREGIASKRVFSDKKSCAPSSSSPFLEECFIPCHSHGQHLGDSKLYCLLSESQNNIQTIDEFLPVSLSAAAFLYLNVCACGVSVPVSGLLSVYYRFWGQGFSLPLSSLCICMSVCLSVCLPACMPALNMYGDEGSVNFKRLNSTVSLSNG